MARGPRPKPARLRILEGKAAHRPLPEQVELAPRCPLEPDWAELLPGDDDAEVRGDASSFWRLVVPELDRAGLLAAVDGMAMVEAAVCVARILECERRLSIDGLMMTVSKRSRDGTTWTEKVRNPLSVTVKEYRASFARSVDQLGLAPASRARLRPGAPPPAEDDPWA